MTIRGWASTLPGTCGVGLFSGFQLSPTYYNHGPGHALTLSGIGYAVAGFTNIPSCKEVYDDIKERYDIVFQSPVKKNENSNNQFFFIVYTKTGK